MFLKPLRIVLALSVTLSACGFEARLKDPGLGNLTHPPDSLPEQSEPAGNEVDDPALFVVPQCAEVGNPSADHKACLQAALEQAKQHPTKTLKLQKNAQYYFQGTAGLFINGHQYDGVILDGRGATLNAMRVESCSTCYLENRAMSIRDVDSLTVKRIHLRMPVAAPVHGRNTLSIVGTNDLKFQDSTVHGPASCDGSTTSVAVDAVTFMNSTRITFERVTAAHSCLFIPDGGTLTKAHNFAMSAGNDYVTLKNCQSLDSASDGFKAGGTSPGHVLISGGEWRRNGFAYGTGDAFDLAANGASGIVIEDVMIEGNYNGFEIKEAIGAGSAGIPENMTLRRVTIRNSYVGGISINSGANHLLVEDSLIENNPQAFSINGTLTGPQTHAVTVRRSLIRNNSVGGVFVGNTATDVTIEGSHLEGNGFYSTSAFTTQVVLSDAANITLKDSYLSTGGIPIFNRYVIQAQRTNGLVLDNVTLPAGDSYFLAASVTGVSLLNGGIHAP